MTLVIAGMYSLFATVCFTIIFSRFDFKASVFNLDKKSRERAQILERIKEEQGNVEIKGLLNKLDFLIKRTGIKLVLPWFTTEVFIILLFLGTFIVTFLSLELPLIGCLRILPSLTYVFFLFFFLNFKSNNMYESLDDYIPEFIDILLSGSKHTNDITEMFRFSLNYINGPMFGYIQEFVSKVATTKSTDLAFSAFTSNFENEKFVSIIRSLEIASHGACDYQTILENGKETIQRYSTSREIRKSNYRKGIGSIVVLIVLSLVMIYGSSIFTGQGLRGMLQIKIVRILLTFLVAFLYFAILKLQTMKGR